MLVGRPLATTIFFQGPTPHEECHPQQQQQTRIFVIFLQELHALLAPSVGAKKTTTRKKTAESPLPKDGLSFVEKIEIAASLDAAFIKN